jgi:hypothetical protein
MISDASQLAVLNTAVDIAHGRRKLTVHEREIFTKHIEAIRQRIIDAAAKRNAKGDAR